MPLNEPYQVASASTTDGTVSYAKNALLSVQVVRIKTTEYLLYTITYIFQCFEC